MLSKKVIHDILPEDIWKWRHLENVFHNTMSLFNFQEIRPSLLQSTELLDNCIHLREREHDQNLDMLYRIDSEEGVSLRPEGTITVLRSKVADYAEEEIQRVYYLGPMFRRNHNKTCYNQFHQIGAEILGSSEVISDSEIIRLGLKIFHKLGLHNIRLEINSFGCSQCRPNYLGAIRKYVDDNSNSFCADCHRELVTNPGLITQCGVEACKALIAHSPAMQDFLCDDCKKDFYKLQKILNNIVANFTNNPHLPFSFGYYNRTIFSFYFDTPKGPILLGSGGRYDLLSQRVTGKQIHAVGFSAKIETIMHLMEEKELFTHKMRKTPFKVGIYPNSPNQEVILTQLSQELHEHDFHTIIFSNKYNQEEIIQKAIKNTCSILLIVSSELLNEGKVLLKNILKDSHEFIHLNEVIGSLIRIKKSISN